MAKQLAQDGDGWESQLRKGTLEMAILATLWHERLYGLEILRGLEGTSTLGLAEGTLYLILSRLKGEGLVLAEWVEAETGHPRKYYWLTPAGRERLRRMARFWTALSASLGTLLAPALERPAPERKERTRAER